MLHLNISDEERLRLKSMMIYEEEGYLKGYQCIAGIDEAGRGPLAGPVVAAACILPRGLLIPQMNDSKQLTPKVRGRLFDLLLNEASIQYGVGVVEPVDIDRINIYQATVQAMLMAVQQLPLLPDYVLVDGLSLPHPHLPCVKIIKGDQRSQSIAAASIIAKETRDRLMSDYHVQWPQYGFNQHKGYGTKNHLKAILEYGPCTIHRRSFEPIKSMVAQEAGKRGV